MNDQDGFRIEAALQFGFSAAGDDAAPHYICSEVELIAFAKACERKGLATAATFARNVTSATNVFGQHFEAQIAALDAEIEPIKEAAEARFMTAQGYVRGTDEPGKRWVKPDPNLCDDEGCPHYGTDHVCINRTEPR
jgi:hypothetical protein